MVGTYLHGPVLARNPALADLLLAWALGLEDGGLPPLDDDGGGGSAAGAARRRPAAPYGRGRDERRPRLPGAVDERRVRGSGS